MEAMQHCSEIISSMTTSMFFGGILFFGMAFCAGVIFEKSQNGEKLI